MKLAAAYAIADLITDADRSEENIIPVRSTPRGRGCGKCRGKGCPRDRRGTTVSGGYRHENDLRTEHYGYGGAALH